MSSKLSQSFMDRLPLLYVFFSGMGFSIQMLIIKILTEHGYQASFHCSFSRGCLQLLMSCLFIHWKIDIPEGTIPPKLFGNTNYVRWILFWRSIFGYGGTITSFLATEYLPVGDAQVLLMLSPMLSAILGFLILGEPWRRPEFIGTILSLIGAVFVCRPPFIFGEGNTDTVDPKRFFVGVVIALFGSGTLAVTYIFVRLLGTTAKMPWPYVTFSQSLVQSIGSALMLYFLKIPFNPHFTWSMRALIVASAIIGTWSQVGMTIGMQREKSASATAMRMSDVIFGFIWQAAFTSDRINGLAIIGAILVSSSILIVVIYKEPSPPALLPSKPTLSNEDHLWLSQRLKTV